MRIGIDLGGTKIEGIALDSQGREAARQRVATPQGDYAATVRAICDLINNLEIATDHKGAAAVGVGIPGAISTATGRIKNANSTCLIGEDLRADLSTRLDRTVKLENDANCFIVSEVADGAARGANVAFGVILGTGVGGGITFGGRPHRGINAIAGEWGHNPLPWPQDHERPGPLCYCGKSGCIETFLSGPGLARDAGPMYPDGISVIAAMRSGDPAAHEAFERYTNRLARALANVINVLDPDVIVLGGGMSNIDELYDAVQRDWINWVFSDHVDTRLTKATHGDSSGVRGAAWLWPKA